AAVLTISFPDAGKPDLDLTMADLMAMPVSSITTTTPWHDGEQRFEGVALSHLMETVGASAQTLRVEALNEYVTELPFSDFADHGPILAYRLNGKEMSVSQKGPLFIIYGFDDKPELNSELFFSRAAWQVRSMSVE
ncbi:MAG: molybdopterin-dependent oxidoreductase, partial [Rhizobiaceae bacterium]|nr:molybdopterin-dependent oxidoreductase [Rhizobiaceae bacterium]